MQYRAESTDIYAGLRGVSGTINIEKLRRSGQLPQIVLVIARNSFFAYAATKPTFRPRSTRFFRLEARRPEKGFNTLNGIKIAQKHSAAFSFKRALKCQGSTCYVRRGAVKF